MLPLPKVFTNPARHTRASWHLIFFNSLIFIQVSQRVNTVKKMLVAARYRDREPAVVG
jgi:hypothetical protein